MDSCAVCEGPGSGIFFGVFTCRPCASFFRRSVRERRQYVCRQQGDCPIDKEGMRNCCRACRLRRCLLTGMRAEMANAEGGSSSDGKSAATTPEVEDPAAAGSRQKMPAPSSAAFAVANGTGGDIVSLNFPLATPLIQRLAQSVREYDNALRAIVVQHFGLGIIVNTRPRLICQSECNLLKRTSAPLQVALVRAQLTDFDALQSHQKASFMQEFSMHFSTLSSADMTVKAFPDQKLHQMVILPGCMMDRDRYEEFCDVTRGHGKDQQVQWDRFGLPLLDRYLNFIQTRYVPLAVTTAEFAALMGLIICNCALNCLGPAACSEQRDQLFAELHSLAIQRVQSSSDGDVRSIPVRFGQLLSLLTEMATLSKELSEFFDLIRVFVDPESGSSFPNFSEAWTDIFSQQQRNGRVGREEGPV